MDKNVQTRRAILYYNIIVMVVVFVPLPTTGKRHRAASISVSGARNNRRSLLRAHIAAIITIIIMIIFTIIIIIIKYIYTRADRA